MEKYLLVSVGAALGGAARYWLSDYVYKYLPVSFPYGTLLVNFIGGLLIGIIIFHFDERGLITPLTKLFLTVGFCGGFTTFSTFSLETFNLLKNSEYLLGSMNIIGNLFFSLFGTYAGFLISRI